MNRVQRYFALRTVVPFNRLSREELMTIAEACRHRRYEPGEIVHPGDEAARRVSVLVNGTLSGSEDQINGALGVLLRTPFAAPILAGAGGATCLVLSRSRFFTIVYECPEILVWLLRDAPDGGPR